MEQEKPITFHIDTRAQADGGSLVAVHGELDIYTAPQLKQEIQRLMDAGSARIVIDLDGLDYLDSSGLGLFVMARKRAAEAGGDLELVCSKPRHRRLFELTGLDRVLVVHRSQDDLVEAPEMTRRAA